MPHSILNRLYLLFRTSQLSAILRLRLIVILSFYNAMLLLHLRNIQIRDMKSEVVLHPFLDLVIGGLAFRARQVQFIHVDRHVDMMLGCSEFGQKTYRFEIGVAVTIFLSAAALAS